MFICWGSRKVRIPMLSTEYWLPENLTEIANAKLVECQPVFFEYGHEMFEQIYNLEELQIIARVVCTYHNEMFNKFDDDSWIQNTADIWEKYASYGEITSSEGSDNDSEDNSGQSSVYNYDNVFPTEPIDNNILNEPPRLVRNSGTDFFVGDLFAVGNTDVCTNVESVIDSFYDFSVRGDFPVQSLDSTSERLTEVD